MLKDDWRNLVKVVQNYFSSFSLDVLTWIGVIWAKYGLWWRKALSQEDNLKRGEWVIWGVWPENLKRISLNPR